jgi:hypothetical protein
VVRARRKSRDFFAGRACDGRAQGLVLLIRTGTMNPEIGHDDVDGVVMG